MLRKYSQAKISVARTKILKVEADNLWEYSMRVANSKGGMS